MNNNTFKQRLRSIEHYAKEVESLKEATKTTESTLEDLVDSLKEFCPFPDGSIIINGTTIRKVNSCNHVSRSSSNGALYYNMAVARPEGGGWSKGSDTQVILFKDVETWKIYQDEKSETI